MLNTFKYNNKLNESKNKNAFGNQPELKGKGPHTDGFHTALNDEEDVDCCGNCEEDEEQKDVKLTKRQETTKKLEERLKDPKLSDKTKKDIKRQIDLRTSEEAEEEKSLKESRKNSRQMVNSIMSKSVFDKLYSKVLKENFGQDDSDVDALGLDDSTPDADFGDEFGDDEFGDDEGDSVTFTLDRATAQTLIDVLQGALGEGGEEDFGDKGDDDLDFGDEEGGDEFGGDDDGLDFDEDEETQGTKPAVDKKKAFQGKSNKVSGPPSPKSGKAKTDVTDETGTKDGAPPIAALQGKNNQVPGSTLKKATDYFK
jgi:hypothetical protein